MIKRKANIELLRLIAMMMVVTIHYIGRGHILENVQMFSGDYFLFNFWNSVIVMAVNLFVIISGYFLIESRIRVQKLIDIVIEVFIWSLGIYIVLTLTGFVPFSLVGLVKSAFPILTKQYWFVSVYVGMYLLSPFVAKGLKSLRQKQHLALMCILICMTTLYLPSKAIGENGYSIVWMLTLYVIAAYLRLYYKPNGKIGIGKVATCIIPILLLFFSKVIIDCIGSAFLPSFLKYSEWFFKNNSIFALAASVGTFILFLNIKVKKALISKVSLTFGSAAFGVYVIHNHPYLRDLLWDKWIMPYRFLGNWWFLPYSVGIIIAIFFVCAVMELARSKVHKAVFTSVWYRKFYDKVGYAVKSKFSKTMNHITKTGSNAVNEQF